MSMVSPRELDLDQIRTALIRQEETIIFALIERALFRRNAATTEPDHPAFRSVLRPTARTFLDHMLLEHERLHATVRRYTSPDEHAFFPSRLPAPALETQPPAAAVLQPNAINVNDQIRALYNTSIIPSLCAAGDDGNYGSATLCDITALQAISKRVHYGKFVAESKFRSQTAEYTRLIEAGDAAGIMELLTNAAVEEKVLRRVRAKASTYGQDIEDLLSAPVVGVTAAGGVARKVDPETIVALYRDFVIPLTKEVEVLYLFERLSGCAVVFVDARGRRAAEAHFAARLPPDATVPTGVRAPPVSYVPRSSVQAVLSDVVCGKARYGIVPLSSASGVLDVSTFHRLSVSKLRVCADVLLYDDQLVIAAMKPGPPAVVHGSLSRLQQVEEWLTTTVPNATLIVLPAHTNLRELVDGAGAQVAVLCTRSEAALAGLSLLETDLPVESRRPSRFVVVSTTMQTLATGSDRSILFFKVRHAPGALARVLAVFTAFGINLENIHPFADPDGGDHACFFAECTGHASEVQLTQAFEKLRECTTDMRCLGSFVSSAAPMMS